MNKKKNVKSATNKKKKFKFSVNPLLITVIILVLVPVSILGYSVIKSIDTRGVPVVGVRYDDELPNKLSKEQVEQIKGSIAVDGMESVDVTLNAATLRVTVKVPSMTTDAEANTIVNNIYGAIDSVTPIATYFMNMDGKKGYDLEIHAYNLIPTNDEEKAAQVYTILTKTGSMIEPVVNAQTTPKSEDLTYHLMNPVTEEQLEQLKAAVNVEGMEINEVRYSNSRIVVSVKVPGLADNETAKVFCEQVYNQVNSILPIDNYFSNRGEVERYSLEIHVFNVIPKEGEESVQQFAASLTKTSGSSTYKLSTNDESE